MNKRSLNRRSSSALGENPRGSAPADQPNCKDGKSLVCIHQQFLQRVNRKLACEQGGDAQQLLRLKRRRIALSAELQSARECRITTTVGDFLNDRHRFDALVHQRPYLRGLDPIHRQSVATDLDQRPKQHGHGRKESSQEAVLNQLHRFRQERKIAAVARLIGRSVHFACLDNDQSNVVGLRVDVSIKGVYIESYHVFFELVTTSKRQDDNNPSGANKHIDNLEVGTDQESRIYLHFKEHTLPVGIDYLDIIRRNIGEDMLVGPLDVDGGFEQVATCLQACSEELQRSCHAFRVRQETARFLREQGRKRQGDGKYTIQRVETKKAFRFLSFDLHWAQQTYRNYVLHVELGYTDPQNPQPTEVVVSVKMTTQILASSRRVSSSGDVVSDDEDDDRAKENDRLTSMAKASFERLAVSDAIDEIVAHRDVDRT